MSLLFVSVLALLLSPGSADIEGLGFGHRYIPGIKADHSEWSALLSQYVNRKGQVNYRGFMKDSTALNDYLEHLGENAPAEDSGRNEKLAYYINLYNAATVKLILDHYPLKSIKDIKKPWDREWVKVGKATLSLGQIEHDILRKMKEPRIHFAINCASLSCPKLWNRAFTANELDEQLHMVTRGFVRDNTHNRISRDAVELSKIFKWYKGDFTEEGSLLEYIAPYTEIRPDHYARISYKDYNWSLNEAR